MKLTFEGEQSEFNAAFRLPLLAEWHKETLNLLNKIITQGNDIMATQADLVTRLDAHTELLKKIGAESSKTLQLVADLKAAQANAPVTPEVEAAMARLEAQTKLVDDLVPDPVVPAPAPAPAPVQVPPVK